MIRTTSRLLSGDITPFHEDLLPAAAELLAGRHRRHRAELPLLPARFENRDAALTAVTAAWRRPRVSGAAAMQDGRLLGYLFGETVFDTLRGRTAWVRTAGHALADDAPPDLYADLYAAAGPAWLRQGSFDHYVMAPAGDRAALEVWYALNFGQEQVYALRSLDEPPPAAPDPTPDVVIRRATKADHAVFVEMAQVLRLHLTLPPVWAAALPESREAVREGFAELIDDEEVTVWLALREGRALSYQVYLSVSGGDDDLLTPERCALLEIAATLPEARGLGLGRALTARGLSDAAARGFKVCLCDWRTANREAHRFWPAFGFRFAFYRLARKVDPRISWATA